MDLVAAAGKDDVLLAGLDQLISVAYAMGAGGAGGGDGIIDPLDPEGHRQAGAGRVRHDPGHHRRPDLAGAPAAQYVRRGDHVLGGGAAGAHDQSGARVGYLVFIEVCIGNRLLHRQVGVSGGVAHKPFLFPADQRIQVKVDGGVKVGPEAQVGVFL